MVATEEIFITDWANVLNDVARFLVHGDVDGWKNFNSAVGLLAFFDDFRDFFLSSTRDGDDDFFDIVTVDHLFDVFAVADDWDVVNLGALFRLIVVNNADDFVTELWVAGDFVDNHTGRIASTDNHSADALVIEVDAFSDITHNSVGVTSETNSGDHPDAVDEEKAAWNRDANGALEAESKEIKGGSADDDIDKFWNGGVFPYAGIETKDTVDEVHKGKCEWEGAD